MSKVRVAAFFISLDGYGAGPDQSLENPLGRDGPKLAEWFYPTRTFKKMVLGQDGGTTGIDDEFAARGFENVGAVDHGPQHVRADPGRLGATRNGRAGGAITHPIMRRSSS